MSKKNQRPQPFPTDYYLEPEELEKILESTIKHSHHFSAVKFYLANFDYARLRSEAEEIVPGLNLQPNAVVFSISD